MKSGTNVIHRPGGDTANGAEQILNGTWDFGEGRRYRGPTTVPGLPPADPTKMATDTFWFRRAVTLPGGHWKQAVLVLKGARFAPAVYVNGTQVSRANGGMQATVHPLAHAAVQPGATVTVEIALQSLHALPLTDASRIPLADHFRSDLTSHLWDDVLLETYGDFRVARIIPQTDFAGRKLTIRWEAQGTAPEQARVELADAEGKPVAHSSTTAGALAGELTLELPAGCRTWSPEDPYCHTLTLTLSADGQCATRSIIYGFRDLRVNGLGFELNGHPYQVRGSNTPWFRWLRDPETRDLAWDRDWWETNIMRRFKAHGANFFRFHLGPPPEWMLEMCDRYGLIVQYEWVFFHGLTASVPSMVEQWRAWVDTALRHPSVGLFQLYNETDESVAAPAWVAWNQIASAYPPLLLAHRDTLHLHHYWWSLFENLELSYDSVEQIGKVCVVDEFGGDYLDGAGNPGSYPTARGAFQRFLGPDSTVEQRLELQALATGRVGEYWRRLGVAGLSPFCTLGAPADGNHWFLGPLKDARPKPVWAAVTPAFSPRSVSLELWDRNFQPGQRIEVPLHFFNDTATAADLKAVVRVDRAVAAEIVQTVPAWGRRRQTVALTLPHQPGRHRLSAQLLNPTAEVTEPVVSAWDVWVLRAHAPAALADRRIGLAADEQELREFLEGHGLAVVDWSDPAAEVLLASRPTWNKLAAGGSPEQVALQRALGRGRGAVLLDLTGPGQAFTLADGLSFNLVKSDAESCIHATPARVGLWAGLEPANTWLWNGLRGGRIVPPEGIDVASGSAEDFLALWKTRGADEPMLREGSYYAYEQSGIYSFAKQSGDEAVKQQLQQKVQFLFDDAPALTGTLNPFAPVVETDLSAAFRQLRQHRQTSVPLALCGQGLHRSPVWMVDAVEERGRVILSLLLTAGRLGSTPGPTGLYDVRHDEAAAQMVLNMLALAAAR